MGHTALALSSKRRPRLTPDQCQKNKVSKTQDKKKTPKVHTQIPNMLLLSSLKSTFRRPCHFKTPLEISASLVDTSVLLHVLEVNMYHLNILLISGFYLSNLSSGGRVGNLCFSQVSPN